MCRTVCQSVLDRYEIYIHNVQYLNNNIMHVNKCPINVKCINVNCIPTLATRVYINYVVSVCLCNTVVLRSKLTKLGK